MIPRHVCDITTPAGHECSILVDTEDREFHVQVWETCPVVGRFPGPCLVYSWDSPTGRQLGLALVADQPPRLQETSA